MTKLATLLPDYVHGNAAEHGQDFPDVDIAGLKLDSRQVTHGDCFVAVPGYQVDGRNFVSQALAAGAVAVLQQANSFSVDVSRGVPILCVPHLNEQLSAIAGRFYQSAHGQLPSERVKVVGVTGTNGKTTVTHLLAQLYQGLGQQAAVLGTLGSGFIDALLAEKNTTPDPMTVQARIAGLANEGAEVVAMEVSSHALVQGRVSALHFNAVVATNVSRDHLDYHGSMESYAAAKEDLFTHYPTHARIYNLDDAYVREWFERSPGNALSYSLRAQADARTLLATDIEYHDQGASMTLHWQDQQHRAHSSLVGEFNVSNVLAAVTTLLADGFELTQIIPQLATLRAVAGRMETYTGAGKALAIVDYAHTPDALEQVLKAARRHCSGQLWCVFGCGGDRDRGKRPQMGAVASQYADVAVVTDDNPRTEAPLTIIADIVSGMKGTARIIEHPGRRDAVLATLAQAAPDDVVVFAGKGHEDYQIIGTQTYNYNERAVVEAYMQGSVTTASDENRGEPA